jgi:hypothetical protein
MGFAGLVFPLLKPVLGMMNPAQASSLPRPARLAIY